MTVRLAVCALLTLFVGDASATTVTYTPESYGPTRYDSYPDSLAVLASPGEENVITLEAVDSMLRVRDTSGIDDPLSPECVRVDALTVDCPHASTRVDTGDLSDTVLVPANVSASVAGGDGNDDLRGPSVLGGEAGDDVLVSTSRRRRSGAWLYGGPGADRLTGAAGPDELDGGGGEDRLDAGAGDDELTDGDTSETADADVLEGGPGFDRIAYGDGDDNGGMEWGRTGGVSVDLTHQPTKAGEATEEDQIAGFEDVVGGLGPDRLVIGDGMRAVSGDGDDVLVGDAGAQTLDSGAGSDDVRSGGGRDTVWLGGYERDYADLGPGIDRVYLPSPSRIDLERPSWPRATKFVKGAEELVGGANDDVLLGNANANFIDGDGGNDVIHGRAGADLLRGSFGNDELSGGDGDDRLNGHAGHDALRGGNGDDQIAAGSRGPELFYAGYGDADRVFGGRGADTIAGYWGEDLLRGGPGPDSIAGGFEADALTGGAGADVLDGGAGDDRVAARDRARDRIACGPGLDAGRADWVDAFAGCELLRRSKNEGRTRRPS